MIRSAPSTVEVPFIGTCPVKAWTSKTRGGFSKGSHDTKIPFRASAHKRQDTAALQNLAVIPRSSLACVVECGGAPPLFDVAGKTQPLEEKSISLVDLQPPENHDQQFHGENPYQDHLPET